MPSYKPNNDIGVAGRAAYNTLTLTITNTINYQTSLYGGHNLNILVGHEGVDYNYEGFQAITQGQNNDYLTTMSSGSKVVSWGDVTDSYGYLSFFARGEYNYKNRYYADFSLRTDASSRFGRSGRWAAFWSVGLMWNAKREKFLHDALTRVSTRHTTALNKTQRETALLCRKMTLVSSMCISAMR